jgi:hypothetical protein
VQGRAHRVGELKYLSPKRTGIHSHRDRHPQRCERNFPLTYREIISDRETTEAEKFIQEREMVRAPSSQQQLPRRRGRPRKNKEIMKAQIAEEPRIKLIAEELLRRAIRLEPAGKSATKTGTEQGEVMSWEKMRKSISAAETSKASYCRALSGKQGIKATTSDKDRRSVSCTESRRECGMVEKVAQRGTRHYCTAARGTKVSRRKAHGASQRMAKRSKRKSAWLLPVHRKRKFSGRHFLHDSFE